MQLRELPMTWYFEPYRSHDQASQNGNDSAHGDDDCAQGSGALPAAVLQRHGARVLDPATAVALHGQRPPRPTVYRARTLLVPEDLHTEPGLGAINRALAPAGLRLVSPGRTDGGLAGGQDRASREAPGPSADGGPRRLPRTAVLVPAAAEHGRAAVPVVVDAWVALQTLRAAAAARTDKALHEEAARRISLEHLLFGAGLTGSPISEGGGVTGPGAADSYLQPGGDARAPAGIFLTAPHRQPAREF